MDNCVVLYTKKNVALLKNISLAFPNTKIKIVFCKERPIGNFSFIENKHWRTFNSSYWVWLGLENVNNDCLIIDSKCKIPQIPSYSCVYYRSSNAKTKVGISHENKTVLRLDFGLENTFTNSFYLSAEYVKAFNSFRKQSRYKYFSHEIINLMIDSGYKFQMEKI